MHDQFETRGDGMTWWQQFWVLAGGAAAGTILWKLGTSLVRATTRAVDDTKILDQVGAVEAPGGPARQAVVSLRSSLLDACAAARAAARGSLSETDHRAWSKLADTLDALRQALAEERTGGQGGR